MGRASAGHRCSPTSLPEIGHSNPTFLTREAYGPGATCLKVRGQTPSMDASESACA